MSLAMSFTCFSFYSSSDEWEDMKAVDFLGWHGGRYVMNHDLQINTDRTLVAEDDSTHIAMEDLCAKVPCCPLTSAEFMGLKPEAIREIFDSIRAHIPREVFMCAVVMVGKLKIHCIVLMVPTSLLSHLSIICFSR